MFTLLGAANVCFANVHAFKQRSKPQANFDSIFNNYMLHLEHKDSISTSELMMPN